MALIALRKLNLQTRMRSHPMGLHVWLSARSFVYFNTLSVRTAKALARLCGCAGSSEPSLVAYVISTIISWAGSNMRGGTSMARNAYFSANHRFHPRVWGIKIVLKYWGFMLFLWTPYVALVEVIFTDRSKGVLLLWFILIVNVRPLSVRLWLLSWLFMIAWWPSVDKSCTLGFLLLLFLLYVFLSHWVSRTGCVESWSLHFHLLFFYDFWFMDIGTSSLLFIPVIVDRWCCPV